SLPNGRSFKLTTALGLTTTGIVLLTVGPSAPVMANPPHRGWLDWAKEIFTSPTQAVNDVLSQQVEDSFVKAAKYAASGLTNVLTECAGWFVAGSTLNMRSSGVEAVLTITVPIAALVSALMCVIGAGKGAWQADGRAFADIAVGLGKTIVITSSIVVITQAALAATDELTVWMVETTLGSSEALQQRLTGLVAVVTIANPVLALLAATLGLALASILWWELMFRNVALLIVVSAAPIAAAGLVTQSTSGWWVKTRNALIQLVVLKPVMTFCFLLGIAVLGDTKELAGVFAGLLILAVAVIAWPLLASFLAFTDVGQGRSLVAGAMGLVTGRSLGEGGKVHGPSSGPAASSGGDYTSALEAENDATMAASMTPTSTGAASSQITGGAGAAAGTGAAGAAAGAAAPVVLGVQKIADTAVGMANTLQEGVASMAHHSGLNASGNPLTRPETPVYPASDPASVQPADSPNYAPYEGSSTEQTPEASIPAAHSPMSPTSPVSVPNAVTDDSQIKEASS
ncbi:MAG: hypothetical protein H0T78_03695, partial [Longispora sp.]|nr:hypothetical protein [Longispora sp. (in: high G+C Gram-positive bacteria)]